MDIKVQRRRQSRYVRHDKLFVQVLASSKKVEVEKVTLLCHSCNASINGLKIELDQKLEVNSSVDLWLSFEGLDTDFYL